MKLIKQDKPRSSVEAIIRFMSKADIVLNSEQENLFVRLCYTDTLLRSRKYKRDTVIDMLRKRFGISPYRANQDITDAHKAFGETRKLNKNYLISHHIDEIGMQIQLVKESGRLELLPKLNDNYTYALNSIPVQYEPEDHAPAKVIFVYNGATPVQQDTLTELLQQADNYIKASKSDDYIDYEESGRPGSADSDPGDD